MLIKQQDKLSARLEMAHEACRPFAPLWEHRSAESLHRLNVMRVKIGVLHIAVETANVIPLRNKGLSEEAQFLVKAGDGFRSDGSRLCKFVQMTGQTSTSNGIVPADQPLLDRITAGSTQRLDIPDGPPGTLSFSTFLSKTRPDFTLLGLRAPNIGTSLRAGTFGDPAALGIATLGPDWTSGAVWNQGQLKSFGDTQYRDAFLAAFDEWQAVGKPNGAQFQLRILPKEVAAIADQPDDTWIEQRDKVSLIWTLAPSH